MMGIIVNIMKNTLKAIAEEAEPYKGILYGQFMLTADGPKLIEYNARFGDPEAMNVLPLLKTPLVDVCQAVVDGTLIFIKSICHSEAKSFPSLFLEIGGGVNKSCFFSSNLG